MEEIPNVEEVPQKSFSTHFKTRVISAIFSILVVIVSVVFISPAGSVNTPRVLGTSTQASTQTGFSLSRFFASFFSVFSHSTSVHTVNTTIHTDIKTPTTAQPTVQSESQTALSQSQLLALADNKYADGNLPLGDNKYVTDGAKKGYIYLCHAQGDSSGGGAQADGSWIHGSTWNSHEKLSVTGHVSWPNAVFSDTVTGTARTLSGNDLPSHTTGIFPIQSSDPAYHYDHNPNSIVVQKFSDTFPANPTYLTTPSCIGGEVGIMLTGVALFDGFDATLRDAAAHEVQDSCQGHPQLSGEYHYHSLSSCITNVNEMTVIGYALDGFPITGPKVATDKYLTTEDLDVCHGITSEIMLNGKTTTIYHYVMTQDFPYSVSCFHGKPVTMQVVSSTNGSNHISQGQQTGGMHGTAGRGVTSINTTTHTTLTPGQTHPQPPQQAIAACSGKITGTTCSFTEPNGTITGTCQTPPNQTSLVCVPAGGPPR